jgi:molecular chaperone GrpE (heat shock protein)
MMKQGEDLSEEERRAKRGKVAGCMRTGYMIRGRLLRSAHVAVY